MITSLSILAFLAAGVSLGIVVFMCIMDGVLKRKNNNGGHEMGNEEIVIMQVKPHWFIYIGPVIRAVILGIIGLMTESEGMFFLLLAIGIVWMIPGVLKGMTTELVVSSKRIHGKYGIINTRQMDSPINKVQNISVEMKLLGRLFGFGNICITTSSGVYRFSRIGHPEMVKNTIIQAQDDYEEGRFTRQSERYEQAMERQTAAQAAMFGGLAQTMQQAAMIGQTPVNALPQYEQPPVVEQKTPELEVRQEYRPPVSSTVQTVMPGRTVIKEFPYMLWREKCPILITKMMITERNTDDAIELNLEIQNLADKVVEAVFLDIRGLNVLKEEKCDMPKTPFLDLHIEPNSKSMIKPLKLPDNSIRQLRVTIRNVVYTNDSIWEYDGNETLQAIETNQTYISGEYHEDRDFLCRNHPKMQHSGTVYSYYPVFADSYWICACGQFNLGDVCTRCKEEKQVIGECLCQKSLEQRNKERLEQERQMEEELKKREMEEQRKEQERIAKEQELAEQERQRKEEERRQKIEQIQNSAKELVNIAGRKGKEAGEKLKQAVSQQGTEQPKQQTEMMFCGECGKSIEKGTKFCPYCGHQIGE